MKTVFLPGNRITLLESGAAFFPALIAAIENAEREVHIETYIFANDDIGRNIAATLAAVSRRGVSVRVMVDGFGAREFSHLFGLMLVDAGVEVAIYRPEVAALRLRRNRLRRLHRKLAVIDGRIAFVGGINIIDDLDMANAAEQIPPRFDYAVRVEGPLLAEIHRGVRHLWRLVRWASFGRRLPDAAIDISTAPCGNTAAAFVIRDNLRHRRDIEDAYLEAIAAARDEILIASAYFLPGRRFRHALVDAARRGIRVTVLLQGRVEYALLHYATQALYGLLLRGGVRIFEYRSGFLHAKVAVIDGLWATVGSSNIDPFSLLLAREANVIVRDAGFAATLQGSLGRAMESSTTEVLAADMERRSLVARAISWLAYAAVRMLIGLSRYGGRDYRE